MYSVVVLCAGKGTRTGLSYNKMFYSLHGQTVYEKTMNVFLEDKNCEQVVVVTQPHEQAQFQKLIKNEKIEFVNGGKERQDSVYEGLKKCRGKYVLIHDGARPYIQKASLTALLKCLQEHKACLLMVPCKDTIKEVINGKVVKTLKRERLMQAQTPQAFERELILKAYQKGIEAHYQATDDAQMVEEFSDEDVYVVMGDYDNKKITTKDDLI